MSIDMEQFHQTFFEESLEGLDTMEQLLLDISSENQDKENINSIFRAAHSIKGGAGTFGFEELANFTHILETLLDEARDGKRELCSVSVDLLLKSCDCLRSMIESYQQKQSPEQKQSKELSNSFEKLLSGNTAAGEESSETILTEKSSSTDIMMAEFDTLLKTEDVSPTPNTKTRWKISFKPEPQVLQTGNEPLRIFRELSELGDLRVESNDDQLPPINEISSDECYLSWTLDLDTKESESAIAEVFEWVIDECSLEISKSETTTSKEPSVKQEISNTQQPSSEKDPKSPHTNNPPKIETAEIKKTAKESTKKTQEPDNQNLNSSIRVGIDKIDNLINLVGELVITQSMLSELGNNFSMKKLEKLSSGLDQLLQNTKELQESVMRIRMLPISFAFNRFPRMIRDLAQKTGKQVELVIQGEQTELDKTVMERISDPLVHLVRNAIDHGIEEKTTRLKNGKPEQGTIKLDAYHQGGNIVIEIGDDGKGLDKTIIREKAIEKELISPDTNLSDQEIYDLIFCPGFSTAQQVSDISGRGVGMDVVKRNIIGLGGRIIIDSQEGVGTTFKVYLPLTLAILDGQLVRVGDEIYIIPLIAIIESLQVKKELINRVAGNVEIYKLREENIPVIHLHKEFDISADSTELEEGLLVVVESEGQKVGLLVDDLLAQQQVVIKSLESNYQKIMGISGATILGDGSVSMIIDIPGLIDQAAHRSRSNFIAA